MKLFNWMSRLDSPFALDSVVYAIMVSGLCRNAMILEALKVVRAMMGANMVPGPELRTQVYRDNYQLDRVELITVSEACSLLV
ncbi:hypothetical protein F0562_029603 [Nyssa sinensis]|uniref:Pentatricopeptide repeat-containing protein n=1 Tax=Nyssa sinensis TaxID=561372 RepID=A0A5J5B7N8_9ASTE|nr:hypothetical protein F0562_029603 [Nyssa sinensis]